MDFVEATGGRQATSPELLVGSFHLIQGSVHMQTWQPNVGSYKFAAEVWIFPSHPTTTDLLEYNFIFLSQ